MSTVTAIGKNRIVQIKSADRSFGIPSNFGLSLSQYNLNPAYCSWHQISIPNGFFNVNSRSCTISVTAINPSSVAYTVTVSITTGNYSSTTLIPAVITALNAAINSITTGTSTASFLGGSVNSLTGFFTFQTAVAGWTFTINTTLASLDWILGYRAGQSGITGVVSATGAAILDLRAYPDIFIRSSLISGNSLSANGSDSVIAVVQNTALFSQTIFQRSPQPDIDLFPVSGQMSQVNFQLVDEFGHELNMDTNQDWSISICLYFN